MGANNWLGGAKAIAQATDFTPADIEVDDVFKITLSDDQNESHEISFTATAVTVKNVVEGLKAAADSAKAAGMEPWTKVTASEDDTKLTLTANTAGIPFYYTTATVNGGAVDDQTLTPSVATANSGPNDYNVTDNWSLEAIPVNGDDVRIPSHVTDSILYGLDQHTVLLSSFRREEGCTVAIGSVNQPLHIDADTVVLAGTGQAFIKIDNPTSDVIVTESGGSSGGAYGTNLTGAGIAKLTVELDDSSQTLGIAALAGETATVTAIAISGDGEVVVGSGVTKVGGGDVTIIDLVSGTLETHCAVATVNTGGTYTHHSGAISTSLNITGGQTTYNSSGTPAQIILNAGATLTMGPSAANPTTFRIRGSSWTINDRFGRITSQWNFDFCSPGDGLMKVAKNKGWTPSAVA